ncbi:hypothetical protein [Rhodanobacter geophilus]|uniref:Uncharacterized protein n=1 Tax=Rhodanobacter geophilus TaxID=3162488 RepID=A0ABV3QRE1_9GAMM
MNAPTFMAHGRTKSTSGCMARFRPKTSAAATRTPSYGATDRAGAIFTMVE